jgi:hypothetical protein
LISAVLDGAADVVEVPDFVQGSISATEVYAFAVAVGAQGGLDLGGGVGLCGGGDDARGGEPVVAGERLEDVDGFLEEVGDFLGGLVLRVAGGVEGGDAGSWGEMLVFVFESWWTRDVVEREGRLLTVLAELVLPECLCRATVAHPVLLHVVEEIGLAVGLEDLGDVCVSPIGIAVGFVGAIAVVRLSR